MQLNAINKALSDLLVLFRRSQTWLVMKLTVLLILAAFTMAAATGYSQKINLELKNTRLETVFTRVEQISGYSFIYEKSLLKKTKSIDISLQNASLQDAMNTILKNQPLDYDIKGKFIVVFSKSDATVPQHARTENVTARVIGAVTGVVKDTTGAVLPGVSILNKSTGKGASTNTGGTFKIDAKAGDVLVFSFIGFASQTITVGDAAALTIVLKESANQLNAVVVTALGIKKTVKSLTYNVQEIKGTEVTRVPDASFVNSLSGKVAGVTINASASGIGGSTRVVMRGDKSVNGNNNALYVLDGIPLPNLFSAASSTPNGVYGGSDSGDGISSINPEDIESISVLTGAAASALYGSQAANGVILVNTKNGLADKTQVSFANSTTFYHPFVMPKFQDTYGTSSPGAFDSWGAKLNTPSSYNPSDFFQTGYSVSNSISIATGSQKNETYFSAASLNANGIVPNNKFDRYNLTLHNTTKYLNDKLTLDLNLMYIKTENQNGVSQGQYYNPIVATYLFPRGDDIEKYQVYERYNATRSFETQFWPYGDEGLAMQNPYWTVNRDLNSNTKNRYMLGASLKYQVLNWLDVTARVRVDNTSTENQLEYYASTLPLLSFNSNNGGYGLVDEHTNQTYADVIASATRKFKNFGLDVKLGASLLNTSYGNTGYAGGLSLVPNLFALNNIAVTQYNYPGNGLLIPYYDQDQAIFGTVGVNYKSLIFLDASGRNEWSSTLAGSGNLDFFYPSAGLSAILSDMLKLPRNLISYLKIRGSYSEVGNGLPRYIPIPTYPVSPAVVNTTVTNAPYIGLHPERTHSTEFGLDAWFLDSKLRLAVTLYNTQTFNQLFTFAAPSGSGVKNFYVNAGQVNNKGIEASLSYNNNFGPLSWASSATFTLNMNKIVQLVENKISPVTGVPFTQNSFNEGGTGSSYFSYVNKGGSIGDIYVNKLETDEHGYILVNNTGAVTPQTVNSINDLIFAGNSNPRFGIGFRNNFACKNFNLNFLVNGRFGGVVVSETQALIDGVGASLTSAQARDAGGVIINGAKLNPQSYYQTVGSGNGVLAGYVYNATNIRLGEASFGYTIPGKIFRNKLQNVNLSVIGRNLLMFYNRAPFDPETTASTGTYFQGIDYFMMPSMRSFGFSVKATL